MSNAKIDHFKFEQHPLGRCTGSQSPLQLLVIFGCCLIMRFSVTVVVAFLEVGVESFSTVPHRVAPSVLPNNKNESAPSDDCTIRSV
jgi:hypothetical protein